MIKVLISLVVGFAAAWALNYVAPMQSVHQFSNLGSYAITGSVLAFLAGTIGSMMLLKKG